MCQRCARAISDTQTKRDLGQYHDSRGILCQGHKRGTIETGTLGIANPLFFKYSRRPAHHYPASRPVRIHWPFIFFFFGWFLVTRHMYPPSPAVCVKKTRGQRKRRRRCCCCCCSLFEIQNTDVCRGAPPLGERRRGGEGGRPNLSSYASERVRERQSRSPSTSRSPGFPLHIGGGEAPRPPKKKKKTAYDYTRSLPSKPQNVEFNPTKNDLSISLSLSLSLYVCVCSSLKFFYFAIHHLYTTPQDSGPERGALDPLRGAISPYISSNNAYLHTRRREGRGIARRPRPRPPSHIIHSQTQPSPGSIHHPPSPA